MDVIKLFVDKKTSSNKIQTFLIYISTWGIEKKEVLPIIGVRYLMQKTKRDGFLVACAQREKGESP